MYYIVIHGGDARKTRYGVARNANTGRLLKVADTVEHVQRSHGKLPALCTADQATKARSVSIAAKSGERISQAIVAGVTR
jgi:hypothetical protein